MLRSIGKQSGESILKKKREVTVGRICGKGRFYAWNERVMDDESGESMEPYPYRTTSSACGRLVPILQVPWWLPDETR